MLVPQFSTDDISPFPPLCIGCSEGRSTTQHTLKKASPGRQQHRQQEQQQQQIRAFTADATATATTDVPPSHNLLGSFLRRRQGVNMVGDLAVLYLYRSANPTLTHGRRAAAIFISSSAALRCFSSSSPAQSHSRASQESPPPTRSCPSVLQHCTPNPRPHTVFKHQLCECAGQGREELDPNRSSHTPSLSSHY